jgi:hypothetical protein
MDRLPNRCSPTQFAPAPDAAAAVDPMTRASGSDDVRSSELGPWLAALLPAASAIADEIGRDGSAIIGWRGRLLLLLLPVRVLTWLAVSVDLPAAAAGGITDLDPTTE